MDREEECICCQEIQVVLDKNEVYEAERPQKHYGCVTDNPGFRAVWFQSLWNWFEIFWWYGQEKFTEIMSSLYNTIT